MIFITPLQYFFDSFYRVFRFFERMFSDLITKIYNATEYNFLFYMALLPFVLMFVFDLVMSFILSIRYRQIKIFNVFSAKSWRIIGEQKNFPREVSLKHSRLSPLSIGILRNKSYKNARSGDIILHNDGSRSTFLGTRLCDNQYLYAYKTVNGIVYSTLKPYKWAKANGSQRNDSIIIVYKKNNNRR